MFTLAKYNKYPSPLLTIPERDKFAKNKIKLVTNWRRCTIACGVLSKNRSISNV